MTPERRLALARLCEASRDGIAMMFGDSHYDRQTWGAIKPHLDFVTDTIIPEALAEVDRLTEEVEILQMAYDALPAAGDGLINKLAAKVIGLKADITAMTEVMADSSLRESIDRERREVSRLTARLREAESLLTARQLQRLDDRMNEAGR